MYNNQFDIDFEKSYKKLIKGSTILEKKFLKTIKLLAQDPKYPSLNSHKVDIIDREDIWVSKVSGDIRIVWFYDDQDGLVITCLKLGTHSGSTQIYKSKSS